jgi:hypothetical protein|tara:strand:+ start:11840 stop:12127 length:288 start_codon:yes stop_codon:yes gene_type:complete
MGYIASPHEIAEHIVNDRDNLRHLLFMFHDVMKNGRKSDVLKAFNNESRLTGKNKTWGKKELFNYLVESIDKMMNVEDWGERERWREHLMEVTQE